MTNPLTVATATKKYTPNGLISKRDNLILDIKDLWFKLSKNNIVPNGTKQLFDLNAIYKQLAQKEIELVKTKLAIQAINMGFKTLDALPANNVYTQIYLLQQLKERKVKLEKVPTRKNENESVVFTKGFIDAEITKVSGDIDKIQKEINEFNNNVEFTEK